ncbi:MAG: HNH endonuclease [Actinomycetota bacterium]|nr:HNH endonuclease [Actinomycetota bacterium]
MALELDQGSADPAGLSDADLIEGIVGFERVTSWAQARQAGLLAEFARRRPEDSWQARRSDTPSRCSEFAPDEVGLALRLSRTTASNRLAIAETVVQDLPRTHAAWQAGLIDTPKVRAITETSCLLTGPQREILEARVLPRAPEQTLAQLRRTLLRAVLAIDPEGAERRYRERRTDRRVVVSPDGEGMSSLWALLSAPDATASYERLGQLARGLGAEDPRGMDARRADLLVELLTGRRCAATGCATKCDGDCDASCSPVAGESGNTTEPGTTPEPGTGPGRSGGRHGCCPHGRGARLPGPGKPLVQVTVPITMLMGLDEQPGELAGYGPIPASLARELAAQGTWRRLLTDPESGVLLDYGRTTYAPPVGLADFVRARDAVCRFCTCGQPAARADLDHTVAYADGGPTSDRNLYAGCRHHHLGKTHVPGWHVDQHDDGRITWTTPTGHSYTSHPHDYRPDPPAPPAPTPETAVHDPPPF